MNNAIKIDEFTVEIKDPRKSVAHTVKITEDQKLLIERARAKLGSEVTAEWIRRGIEAAMLKALDQKS